MQTIYESLNPDYAIGHYYNSQLLQTQAFT